MMTFLKDFAEFVVIVGLIILRTWWGYGVLRNDGVLRSSPCLTRTNGGAEARSNVPA